MKADEHDNRRELRCKIQPDIHAAENLDQLIANDLYDLLARTQTLQYFRTDSFRPHSIGELFDDLEIHVRFEKCHADLFQGFLDVKLRQPAFTAQILEDAL